MKDAVEAKDGYPFQRVRSFLEQTAHAQGVRLPGDSDSLFDNEVLDSFGLLEFIGFLEDAFAIKIPEEDLTPDRFETIEKIRDYLETHVAHSS